VSTRLRRRCLRATYERPASLSNLVTHLSTFSSLDLHSSLIQALQEAGYTEPTPIQAQAIPPLLERRDVLGCAQTGTGKTAAFVLPILHRLLEHPTTDRGRRPIRALILSPTRELASQIGDSIRAYGRYAHVRHTVIFGGVKQGSQIRALRNGVDIVVATPGRLLDLQRQGFVDLSSVEFFVLDEADRMLDMGFIRDIRTILELIPERRQNLLFSATMPPNISELGQSFMHRPVQIEVTPPATTVERIDQAVCFVEKNDKKDALVKALDRYNVDRAIVFTRTKHGANKLVRQLVNTNIHADAIHGNKSQNARERALDAFRKGELRLLVATDIASRGIDVEGVSHVFVYDLPDEAEAYVHRIGRTGRAGREGIALTFCSEEERDLLDDVLRVTQEPLPIVDREGNTVGTLEVPKGRPGRRKRGGGGRGRAPANRGGRRGRTERSSQDDVRTSGQDAQQPRRASQKNDAVNQERPRRSRANADQESRERPAKARPRRGRPAQDASKPRRERSADDAPQNARPRRNAAAKTNQESAKPAGRAPAKAHSATPKQETTSGPRARSTRREAPKTSFRRAPKKK